jgi:hypothetical protein
MAGTVRRNGPSTQGSWDCPHGVISLDTLLDVLGSLGIWVYRPRSWKNPITEISKESQICRISGSPGSTHPLDLWIYGSKRSWGYGDITDSLDLWILGCMGLDQRRVSTHTSTVLCTTWDVHIPVQCNTCSTVCW